MSAVRKWGPLVAVVALIILIIGAAVWYLTPGSRVKAFPISPADSISSWSFKGTYSGNAALTKKANADIAKLRGQLGDGKYDDYDLYLGMGNDESLLGDGKVAYDYYNRAIALHSDKGLAYVNLAHLMSDLGAYHTAANAFTKAVAVEPGVLQYQIQRLTFLTNRFATDTPMVTTALNDVYKQFGYTEPTLVIKAQWLEGQGKYTDAVDALKIALQLAPPQDRPAIQAEMTRDRAKAK